MRRFVDSLLACLATVALLVGLLLLCVRFVAFDGAFYRSEMIGKLGVPQRLGMSAADTGTVIDRIISYCKGDTAELNLEVTIAGETQPFFNDREITHMVDVQHLFALSEWAMWGGFAGFALLMGLALLVGPRRARLWRAMQGMAAGIAAFLLAGGVVAVFAVLDFDRTWDAFHRIFFTNDLWLLDYRTDRLINMMPLEFFWDTVTRIGIFFGSALLVLFVALFIGLRVSARNRSRAAAFEERGAVRRERMRASGSSGEEADLRRTPEPQEHFVFEESVRELGLSDADDEDAVRTLYGETSAGRRPAREFDPPSQGAMGAASAAMGADAAGIVFAPASPAEGPAYKASTEFSPSAASGAPLPQSPMPAYVPASGAPAYAPAYAAPEAAAGYAYERTVPEASYAPESPEARSDHMPATAPGFTAAPFQSAAYGAPIPGPLTSAPPVLPTASRPYGAPVEPADNLDDEYRASAYAPAASGVEPEPQPVVEEPARPLDLLSDADIDAMVRRWRAGAQGLRKDLVEPHAAPILRPVELPDWLSEYPPDARTIDALNQPPRDPSQPPGDSGGKP